MNEKQRLLNEDLKRFRLLMEYDFYIGEDDNEEGDLLFDDEPQGDEAPEGDAPEDGGGFDAPEGEAPEGEEGGEFPEGEVDPDTEFGEELPAPEPMGDEMGGEELPPEPMEDEVELDITQLVQGTDAAKQSADQANQQISGLMAKFDELAQSLDKMDAINAKIDDIEHEIETRNPTPEEQLEMRSLDSFPYNLKLTDYWSEKEGHYDAMGENDQKEGEDSEFVLTQDEVDQDYNAIEVKDSFGSDKEREQMKY
jgi:hypothetical protein